jgi:hypothetical protein
MRYSLSAIFLSLSFPLPAHPSRHTPAGDELVATELIFSGLLADLQPEEAVALLSALVFQVCHGGERGLVVGGCAGRVLVVCVGCVCWLCVLVVCWVWQMVGAGQGCFLIDCSVFAWVWPVVVEDGGGWEGVVSGVTCVCVCHMCVGVWVAWCVLVLPRVGAVSCQRVAGSLGHAARSQPRAACTLIVRLNPPRPFPVPTRLPLPALPQPLTTMPPTAPRTEPATGKERQRTGADAGAGGGKG